MFCRSRALPQRNLFRPFAARHWARGYVRLPDERRWALYTYLVDERIPPPHESVLRCEAFPQFSIRFGEAVDALMTDAGGVALHTKSSRESFNRVIVCTGFETPLIERPELAGIAARVLTWRDRLGEARTRSHTTLAKSPYLGAGFELLPRDPKADACVRDVHVFDWNCLASLGAVGGDIPGIMLGATQLAAALAADLFVRDADAHEARLRQFAERELAPTRYYVPPAE